MKKILLMALFFISVPIVLMGCQTNDSNSDDIVKVSVSESREFGKINTDFLESMKMKRQSICLRNYLRMQ